MLTTPCKERAALATEEQPWSAMENVSFKNKLIGPSTSGVFGEQKKCNAAMLLDVWSDLHKRSERSIRQNYRHRGDRRMFKPFASDITSPTRDGWEQGELARARA